MLNRQASKFLWNLDWNLLKVFSAIVQFGGVTRAAVAINRQQPSVSGSLKRLEEHLGVILCKRGPGGFGLTDEGIALAQICTNIEGLLSSVPDSLDAISTEVMFQVRLIVVNNLISPRLDNAIAEFSRRYPRAELLINVASCSEIESKVSNDEAEIGVGPVTDLDTSLKLKFLYREQHGIVCASSHPLSGTIVEDPSLLAKESFVLPGTDEAVQVVRYRETYGLGSVVIGESLDLNEVRRMVVAGIGVALLPLEFLADDLSTGRLHLLTPNAGVQDDIFIISNPASPRAHAISHFLDLIPDCRLFIRGNA